jgi:hypothetical protein
VESGILKERSPMYVRPLGEAERSQIVLASARGDAAFQGLGVGIDHEPAALAVASVRHWWE